MTQNELDKLSNDLIPIVEFIELQLNKHRNENSQNAYHERLMFVSLSQVVVHLSQIKPVEKE